MGAMLKIGSKGIHMKKNKTGIILFLVPAVLLFLAVFGASLVMLFGSSFTDWSIGSAINFVGIKNYINLFHDKSFLKATENTLIWVVLQSVVHVTIGVLVALILAQKKFYWKFIRTVYMIPNIISSAALGMMFMILLNPQFGIVNKIIQSMGFHDFNVNWFQNKGTAFGAVTAIWLPYAATITILVLAEISAIDTSIYEAAQVDGATNFQTTVYITVPMLRNIIGTSAVLGATSMLQKLDVLMMTTQGGPQDRTLNLPLFIYNAALTDNDFARANTAGVYLIIIGLTAVLIINKVFRVGKADN